MERNILPELLPDAQYFLREKISNRQYLGNPTNPLSTFESSPTCLFNLNLNINFNLNPNLNLNLNLDSTSSQPHFNHISSSLQTQPQINLNLNLNLSSIWLWHKSNPILYGNILLLDRCEYSLIDTRLFTVIIHLKVRNGFHRFQFTDLKDLMQSYIFLTFHRFSSNHKRFQCQSLKIHEFRELTK